VELRRVVGGVGRTLITFGVLVLLFVAYELWGTNIAEARSQRALKKSFRSQLASRPATTAPTVAGAPAPTPTTTTTPQPVPSGEAIAEIRIPRIGVDKFVVQGVGVPDLKKGPGHYPDTPMPGHVGNAAIAGHRTTYGAPFDRLDELKPGDEIRITTRDSGELPYLYVVDSTTSVSPSNVGVLDPTLDARLTLTTCTPKFSASQRLVVVAKLVGKAKPPEPTPIAAPHDPGGPVAAPTAAPKGGLSGVREARTPAILWGVLAGLVGIGTWQSGRRWKFWPAWLLGTPVFLLVLFVFFENFSRLLPANI
jgi:sortase A